MFTINLIPSFFHHKFRAKFHVVCYIFFFFFFHRWFKFKSCREKSHFSSLPLFATSPPLLLQPRRNHRFQYPFLLPLYAPMVDISDKTREPCLILTEEGERVSERESAWSYISSGFEVSHRSSDEDARKRAERIKGDYKLCPCYPRWKRLWIFYAGGGAISIGFSRHSRGHSIKNSVKPVLTSGAPLSAARVKEQSGRGRRLKGGGDHEEWRSSTKLVPGWMKRYIYIYIYICLSTILSIHRVPIFPSLPFVLFFLPFPPPLLKSRHVAPRFEKKESLKVRCKRIVRSSEKVSSSLGWGYIGFIFFFFYELYKYSNCVNRLLWRDWYPYQSCSLL